MTRDIANADFIARKGVESIARKGVATMGRMVMRRPGADA
jgi:hypothetical protein